MQRSPLSVYLGNSRMDPGCPLATTDHTICTLHQRYLFKDKDQGGRTLRALMLSLGRTKHTNKHIESYYYCCSANERLWRLVVLRQPPRLTFRQRNRRFGHQTTAVPPQTRWCPLPPRRDRSIILE